MCLSAIFPIFYRDEGKADGDLMMQAGDTAVDWDKNGNMTLKDDTDDVVLVYNWDNKLRSASYDGNSISIKYDPMGNRVLKYNNTAARKYIVDIAGGLPTILHELDPNNGMEVKRYYIYANGEVLMKHEGYNRYFYLHDRLGSVRQIIQSNRSAYAYGPFGELLTAETAENTENPFKFTGQYYDSEIGQYYLRARQYDPQLMRLTARDINRGKFARPQSLHKYLYCNNDPLNATDPSGKTAWNLLTPIFTGYMLENQALNLAAYGATTGDLRFFDLAELTIEFMPIGVAMATASSFTPLSAQFAGLLTSLHTDITTAGMGASGLLMDGWVATLYSTLIMWKAEDLGMDGGDINDYFEWKGGFFSAPKWWLNPEF